MSLSVLQRGAPAWLSLARRETQPIAMVAAAAMLLLAFYALGEAVSHGYANAFDRAVLETLRAPAGSPRSLGLWANIAASDFGAMGSVSVLAFIVVMACGLLLGLKRWREAALLFLASGGGLAVTNLLKDGFHRDRPPLTAEVAAGLNASFPSGHAMISAAVYLTLGVLVGGLTQRRLVHVYALAVAALLTVMIGLSRIYLGLHWCTDVIAGWCVGAAWVLLWWAAAVVWRKAATGTLPSTRSSRRRPGSRSKGGSAGI